MRETGAFPECQPMAYAVAYHPSSQLRKLRFPGSKEGLELSLIPSLASSTKKGESTVRASVSRVADPVFLLWPHFLPLPSYLLS